MPWISKEMCTGCQICVDECCVGAIAMDNDKDIAFINESKCIRCGVCHDVCPNDAVRHDGERIPEEVESNVAWVKELLKHEYYLNDKKKQKDLITRLQRYFAKNKKVMEKTIERLGMLQDTEYAD
jgi:ferredoxin